MGSRFVASQSGCSVGLTHRWSAAVTMCMVTRWSVATTTRRSSTSAVELGPVEVAQPRPEAEVRPRRVLRLQPGETVDRLAGTEAGAFEEQLARERRAVQFAGRQGQTTILPNLFPLANRS